VSELTRRPPAREDITGVILAGGRARRMSGRDKGLVPFDGRPLVAWVIDTLTPQVGPLLINANRNAQAYAVFGHPVIGDAMPGFEGPLAGLATALEVASTPWVLTVPCDGPFVAPDLAERLGSALLREDAELAAAHDGQRLQPVYALVPRTLAASLRGFLAAGERKTGLWMSSHRLALADFSDRPECFANVNSEADVARLERG
jgi:molybdenum cofactor guanylyltransferase